MLCNWLHRWILTPEHVYISGPFFRVILHIEEFELSLMQWPASCYLRKMRTAFFLLEKSFP